MKVEVGLRPFGLSADCLWSRCELGGNLLPYFEVFAADRRADQTSQLDGRYVGSYESRHDRFDHARYNTAPTGVDSSDRLSPSVNEDRHAVGSRREQTDTWSLGKSASASVARTSSTGSDPAIVNTRAPCTCRAR